MGFAFTWQALGKMDLGMIYVESLQDLFLFLFVKRIFLY